MLSSGVVRVRATAAFAESSRQAALRAGSIRWQVWPRGYAAAVAVDKGIEEAEVEAEAEVTLAATSRRHETTPSHKPPPPPPRDRDERATAAERFRRIAKTEPVEALLSLTAMSRKDLSTLVPKDLLTVLFFVTRHVKPSPQTQGQFDTERITSALQITRALLHARPTLESAPNRDAGFGYTLNGRSLRALLRAGLLFGARQFVVDLFAERMDEQAFSKRHVVNTDSLAIDLAATQEWKLATTLFAGPSELTPKEVYTPRVVAVAMSANLCIHKPWEAVRLFELFDADAAVPIVTVEARCALVRAHLMLGDVVAAQQAVHLANAAGIDNSAIQLAMLRGYRMLGYDADVESRVRKDLDRLGLEPQSAVLNAFVWLRLDAGDLDGAEMILQELERLATDGQLDPETSLIAITIASRRGDMERVRRVWAWLNTRPTVITDAAVAYLCRALGRLGADAEAVGILRAAVRGEPSTWELPAGFRPGIVTANSVLEVATKAQKYNGLLEVSKLMQEAGIEPDERTLITMLEFASRNLVTSPTSLSKFFLELLERTTASPTVDQLNVVLQRVLRVATRDPRLTHDLFAPANGIPTTDPTGGVQLRGKVHRMLAEQIAVLRTSGQKSTGLSLSNRLIYDALALDGMWPVPALQKTWQSFVLRGFRPTIKHYQSLLAAYVKIGAMEEAEDVLRLAAQGSVHGVDPADQRRMLTALLTGWGNIGEVGRARECYKQIEAGAGPDAVSLEAIIHAHLHNGQPSAAVGYARRDLSKVQVEEGTIVTAAHAIRRANDVPGCIFFVANYTEREGGYVLTPKLLAVVRKAFNYLVKQRLDERGRDAILLAMRMLGDDEQTRPVASRRRPTLSKKNSARIAKLLAAGERDDAWEGGDVGKEGRKSRESKDQDHKDQDHKDHHKDQHHQHSSHETSSSGAPCRTSFSSH